MVGGQKFQSGNPPKLIRVEGDDPAFQVESGRGYNQVMNAARTTQYSALPAYLPRPERLVEFFARRRIEYQQCVPRVPG